MANITVSADVHALLNSAGNLTNSTAALGTLGAPVTGASIATKLNGQTIQPATLVLSDFANSTPPANALGLAGGRLCLGNGVAVSGNPLTPRRVAGVKNVNLNGTAKTGARFAIVEIPLTSSETVVGAVLNISGTVKLLFNDSFYISEDPVLSLTIGFTFPAYTTQATTKWQKYTCVPVGTEIVYLVSNNIANKLTIERNAIAGADKLTFSDTATVIASDRWGGAAGNTFTKNSVSSVTNIADNTVAITEETTSAIWLSVEIVMGASGTNDDINFNVVYDLDTAVTLP
jgi:hypothetical protein